VPSGVSKRGELPLARVGKLGKFIMEQRGKRMRLGRLLVAGSMAWALFAAPIWSAEPSAPAAERPKVSVANEMAPRPELDVVTGIRAWRVNGEEIPISAVQNRAMLFHGAYVLQDLVQEKLLLQEAKRRGVVVSEAEVDAKVRVLREDLGLIADTAFDRYLRLQRVTAVAFREMARDYVYMEKVFGDAVYVSDDEVKAAYNQYPDQYRVPETVSFRVMTFRSEAAGQAAKAELTKGKGFEEVAKATALSPQEKVGRGELMVYQKGVTQGLPKELEAAILAAPLNQVSGPVKIPQGAFLIKVEKKVDARQFTLEEMRDAIRARIRKVKLEQQIWPGWVNAQLAAAEIIPVKAD